MIDLKSFILTCNFDEFRSLLNYSLLSYNCPSDNIIMDEMFEAKFDYNKWFNKFSKKEQDLLFEYVSR